MKIVDRGAAFLDDVEPGWAEKIDPDKLDLSDACDCVLGQLYLSEHPRIRNRAFAFDRKLRELGLSYPRAARLGFMLWGNARYRNMTTAWARIIRSRQQETT